MGSVEEMLNKIESAWADDDGPAHDDIARLLKLVRVYREALDWYWLNWGTNDAATKERGYFVSKDALVAGDEIVGGGE